MKKFLITLLALGVISSVFSVEAACKSDNYTTKPYVLRSTPEHERWLKIAKEDLAAAELLLKGELFSSVAYHTQQAAEKSLKAFLVFKKCSVTKTHDLLQLLELCMRIDSDFKKQFGAADYINPFATKFRYPNKYDILDLQEAKLAIKYAQNILDFVVKKVISVYNIEKQRDIFEEQCTSI